MSTIRGRAVKVGGQVVDQGAGARTDPTQLTRPAFRWSAGRSIPTGQGGGSLGGGTTSLFDPSQITFWRFFWVGVAVVYVLGFHVTIGRTRLGIGPAGGK